MCRRKERNNVSILESKGLVKRFGATTALDGVTFAIEPGRIVGLLGPNGSGKTTLLRSIYRTQKMDSGIVRLDDEDITHFSGKKLARNMAVMGQFNQINFDYTVLDIALMGRYPFHSLLEQEKERDYEMALEALDKVGMKSYRDRNFQSLSGGEKQRVAIATALVSERKILVLDEPTSGLDLQHMKEVADELVTIQKIGKTSLVITHDYELIVSCCTHVLHLEHGMVQEQYALDAAGLQRLQNFFIESR